MIFQRCLQTLLGSAAVLMVAFSSVADDYTLEKVETAPKGLAKDVSMVLSPVGYRVVGPDGPLCELWLRKDIPTNVEFQATQNLHYPLTSGELIGAIQVPRRAKFADFRDQSLKPGTYTLRYGKQPQDGNHIGTSDYSDFLLALLAKEDESSANVDDVDQLQESSAEAAGGTHPAIFQLLPLEESDEPATLVHLEDHDFWVLQLKKGSDNPIALRLIVVGHAEE